MVARIAGGLVKKDLFGPGKHGFTLGNPDTGEDPTPLTDVWFNHAQEFMARPAEMVGLPVGVPDYDRGVKVLRRAIGGYTTTISSSTTLTLDQTGIVYVNAANASIILTLPQIAAMNGLPISYRIIRTDAVQANTVTLKPAFSEKCGGGTTGGPVLVGGDIEVLSDGINDWLVQHAAAGGIMVTMTGFFTAPATRLHIAQEGSGAGSGGTSASRVGGGGGSGAYAEAIIGCKFGEQIYITIGAAGTGDPTPTGTGGAGGTVSCGSYLSTGGGSGGASGGSSQSGGGGAGGTVVTAGLSVQVIFQSVGSDGDDGGTIGVPSGKGGAPVCGGATRAAVSGAPWAKQNGGGGSANYAAASGGGHGKVGYVSIKWG